MCSARSGDKELTNESTPSASRSLRLEQKLRGVFDPTQLEIWDESSRHAGHAGASPAGETHFRVAMEAAAFVGQSRLARQRAVLDLCKDEFDTGLHALALELRAPGERG